MRNVPLFIKHHTGDPNQYRNTRKKLIPQEKKEKNRIQCYPVSNWAKLSEVIQKHQNPRSLTKNMFMSQLYNSGLSMSRAVRV